jgi:hypothetical protein
MVAMRVVRLQHEAQVLRIADEQVIAALFHVRYMLTLVGN